MLYHQLYVCVHVLYCLVIEDTGHGVSCDLITHVHWSLVVSCYCTLAVLHLSVLCFLHLSCTVYPHTHTHARTHTTRTTTHHTNCTYINIVAAYIIICIFVKTFMHTQAYIPIRHAAHIINTLQSTHYRVHITEYMPIHHVYVVCSICVYIPYTYIFTHNVNTDKQAHATVAYHVLVSCRSHSSHCHKLVQCYPCGPESGKKPVTIVG